MTTPDKDPPPDRVEQHGQFVISGVASYLADVQMWEPRITIDHPGESMLEFVVPCGPECYRKHADEALNAGWAAARQWLDGGRIPWKPRKRADE